MITTLAFATLCLFPPTLPFQQSGAVAPTEPLSAVEYYTPTRAPAEELRNLVVQLFNSGGVGTVFGRNEPPPTFLTYGRSVVMRYRDDKIGELVALVAELDAQWSGQRGDADDAELVSLEYRARNVTLDNLANALAPFSHPITLFDGMSRYQVSNMSFLDDRGLVVARGPQAEIEQIEAVLKRIDVPQQQVLVTCYLIRGTEAAGGESRLPKELTTNLAKLVPFAGFESLAMGILRSDALTRMTMTVDYAPSEKFDLGLRPRAFDAETGSLTLEQCEFGLSRGMGETHSTQRFTTSAAIHAGEYTVLGAVGAEPIFVVLHLTLAGG